MGYVKHQSSHNLDMVDAFYVDIWDFNPFEYFNMYLHVKRYL